MKKAGKLFSKNIQRPEISPEELAERWDKKKKQIHTLANNIQRLRVNLAKDLKSEDEKVRLTALAIMMMDKTLERVGNNESESNGHAGVTGFRKKNIKIEGNKVMLHYVGKSGVKHDKEFSDERIAKELKWAMSNSPSRYVFCTSDHFRIKADRINRYLSDFDISAKDIRGYGANKNIIEKLKSIPIEEEEKKRTKDFNKVVRAVALKIGHGAPTLKKHYMMPELMDRYIAKGQIIDIKKEGYFKDGGAVDEAEFIDDLSGDHKKAYEMACSVCEHKGEDKECADILIKEWDKNLEYHFDEEEEKIFCKRDDAKCKKFVEEHEHFRKMMKKIKADGKREDIQEFAELLKEHIKAEEKYFGKAEEEEPVEVVAVVAVEEEEEKMRKGGKVGFPMPSKRLYEYALKIKKEYPKVWAKGGNVFGNKAFRNLERVIERGNWLESEEWMYKKWQAFMARHRGDFRIEGVIANLKWLSVVKKGLPYMKEIINAEIEKQYPKE